MKKLAMLAVASCLSCIFTYGQSTHARHSKAKTHKLAAGYSFMPIGKGRLDLGLNAGSSFGAAKVQSRDGFHSYGRISGVPRAGYFLSNHIEIGLLVDGSAAHASNYRDQSCGAGGFVRWYAGKMMREDGTLRRARFFVDGGVTFNGGSAFLKNPDGSVEKVNFSNATPYIMPGFNYFFCKRFALEAGLQLSRTSYSRYGGMNLANENHAAPFIGLHYFPGK